MKIETRVQLASTLQRRAFIKRALVASTATALINGATVQDSSRALYGAAPASNAQEVAQCGYGVCAHVGGGEEWEQIPDNLELMKQAGIRWIRADFSWIGVEPQQGKWRFEHLDRVVDETTKRGLQLLPILDYTVPWATPAYRRLDAWLEYVKRTVERYQDRIQFWEVWNEENLEGFWKDTPSGKNYALLLKETYKTIKTINPNLVVLYGGLAGTPLDYFKESLDAGASKFFDVLNIHPYRGGLTTPERIESFRKDIQSFNEELRRRNLPERSIWITEMGWATPPTFGEVNRRVVSAALQRLYPNSVPKVAFYYDMRYDPSASRPQDTFLTYLPSEKYGARQDLVSFLDSNALQGVSCKEVDVLVMPPSETFPEDCLPSLVEFVKSGGTLVLLGGVPLYYASRLDAATDRYVKADNNPNFDRDLKSLRISWYAWWTRKDTPETATTVVAQDSLDYAPSGEANALKDYVPQCQATRFFSNAALKEGDVMISLLDGQTNDFVGSTACVYKFNSDYRGAVVASAIMTQDGVETNVSTVSNQGVFLPQAYLLAFAFGVERYFWYEFQAPERDDEDKEHHFGIVGQKLAPKPAYHAYKTLTRARPTGSTGDSFEITNGVCAASWTRPDGKRGWALWTPQAPKNATLECDGEVADAFDYLGGAVARPSGSSKLTFRPEILYLVGPNKLTIR